ncbi:MAG: amidohydrolase family protein [Planctomycetaceae bacterium]
MRNLTIRARWLFTIAVASVLPGALAHDVPKPIALENGRILTVEGGKVIEKGTVLIKDEKIAAIGKDVKIPDNARRIDVSGMTIAPGLIDVRSKLWIASDSITASGSSGALDLSKVIDTYSDDWMDVAKQGVTAICVQPSGSMGGRCVVLRVAGGHDEAHLTISEVAGIQASLSGRSSTARYSQYTALKKKLEAVKKYQDEWKKYREALKKWEEEKKKKKSDKGKKDDKSKADAKKKEEAKKPAEKKKIKVIRMRGRVVPIDKIPARILEQMKARGMKIEEIDAPSSSAGASASSSTKDKDGKPKEPKKNETNETLIQLLERKVALRIEVNSADDASNALKLASEMKIDVVLEGLAKLGRSWKKINELRPPLVAGPLLTWETTPARRTDWFGDIAASESLVTIASFSNSGRGSRLLRAHAAKAVAEGLSTDRALEAITINAARVLGLGDKLGSIKVGKHGDLAVFGGHPTDPAAPVMLTISQGQVTYEAKAKLASVDSSRADVSGVPPELPDSYALKSSRVQKADGTFGPATIMVAGGKIVSVGDNAGDDANVFDVGDAVITPGLVVAHAPSSSATSVEPISAHTHAADNFDPESEGFRRIQESGFTTVAYAPVSTNVVAGQVACVRFGADEPVAMNNGWPHTIAGKFVLSSDARSTNRFPSALSGQVDLLERYFSGEDFDSRLFVPGSIENMMDKKAAAHLESIKSGKTIAVFEAESDAEIRAALDLIEKFKLKAVLLEPRDIRDSIDRIKSLGVGIIARAVQASDYDWYAADLAAASNAGVPISFSGTSGDNIRGTIGLLINAGMKPEAAMKALSTDAASMCGLAMSGEIASGRPADLVIWTGSPADFGARPVQVIVDGRVTKETP